MLNDSLGYKCTLHSKFYTHKPNWRLVLGQFVNVAGCSNVTLQCIFQCLEISHICERHRLYTLSCRMLNLDLRVLRLTMETQIFYSVEAERFIKNRVHVKNVILRNKRKYFCLSYSFRLKVATYSSVFNTSYGVFS